VKNLRTYPVENEKTRQGGIFKERANKRFKKTTYILNNGITNRLTKIARFYTIQLDIIRNRTRSTKLIKHFLRLSKTNAEFDNTNEQDD
jgi:glutaredoxin-related protein